jgi:cold shock CspA family protein
MFRLQIQKYIPEKLYGFVVQPETGYQAFFHLGAFNPGLDWPVHLTCQTCPRKGCSWPATPTPPILGEWVDVDVNFNNLPEDRSPRAFKVIRTETPIIVVGKVDVFDCQRGYGFIKDDSNISYYLHRSEVLEGRFPLSGQTGIFYAGTRQGRPRACHVKLCS